MARATRRNEGELWLATYERCEHGGQPVKRYITGLIELYEDCTERGLDITPQQFRRKLLDGMHKKLR
eukprot:SAG22_NODE_12826_length_428_cov_0.620061_1_plen_66_part_10